MPQAATLLVAQVLQALHDIVAQVGDFAMRVDVVLVRLQAGLEELAIHTHIFHGPEGSFAEVFPDPRHHGFMQEKSAKSGGCHGPCVPANGRKPLAVKAA